MKLSTELSETPADASAGHVVPWRKIAAITLGNGLEFFDFSIYTYFATILGRRFFPVGDPMTELLISLAAFGVGFLVRPLGGVVLGIYADRAGRKAALRLTLWLMALGSALFVATPDYSHIGIAAPIMLVFGRLIQGFALGGEVGASTSMLLEYAAENNRAYFCSWQLFSQALSTLVGSFVAIVATNTMSPQDLEGWGWRVPFLVGLLLIPLGSYIRSQLDETLEIDNRLRHGSRLDPLRELFAGYRKELILGTLLVVGASSGNYIALHYLTNYAVSVLHLPLRISLWTSWIAAGLQLVLTGYAGRLTDRIGRKPIGIWSRVALIALTIPVFFYLASGPSVAGVLVASSLLVVPVIFVMVSSLVIITEIFPPTLRATGMSLAYSFGASIFGGFAQFFATWLVVHTGSRMAPALYVLVCTGVSLVAAVLLKD
jgi:MHS family proline/betaine transporter-like MFS transporter